ncbi:MAG: hypothetical protein ACK4K9_06710 [Bacteroidia bacterium]
MSERVDFNATSIGIDERSKQVINVLKKYNYITKTKEKSYKTIEQIDSDSVPIILDILLNYNATEINDECEFVNFTEFLYDYAVYGEGYSNIIVLDSLYEIIYSDLMNIINESIEQNRFLYFVSVFHDGRFENGLKGIKVLTKTGRVSETALTPRYVPNGQSWRAHRNILTPFGKEEHYGGQCNDYTIPQDLKKIGAPDIIEFNANFNFNISQPLINIPNGYKLIYDIITEDNKTIYPENVYDPNHPTFNVNNYINLVPNTFYPTKIYANCFESSWTNTQTPNRRLAPCIPSLLLNYYIDKAVEIANNNTPTHLPNFHPIKITVASDSSEINTCSPWNSNPNPNFNTGKDIDNGVCPKGKHYLGIKYRRLILVPDNLNL